MAHKEQMHFIQKIKDQHPSFFIDKKVLEVGSLNINGTLRDFFNSCDYTGIDVGEGSGVDIVCSGENYDAPDESYDVVCSAECFEHNPSWLETFKNMIRLCKEDGFIFFTCATTGRAEHGTARTTPGCSPLTVEMGWDYYQNLTEKNFTDEINFDNYFSYYEFEVNNQSHDLYFFGIKCSNKRKIVDCFRFFNEKELLELRYHILKDVVDKFVILESNRTFSGNLREELLAKKYIHELNLPENKFIVVETDLPGNDDFIENTEEDIIFRDLSGESTDTYKNSLNARTRERIQLDSLMNIIHEFDDEDIFVVSDCDEIINPEFLKYASNIVPNFPNNLLKVPLVNLEGRANLRSYNKHTNQPIFWDQFVYICMKSHFNRCSPTSLRYMLNDVFSCSYAAEDNIRVEDCGWHFTWMGDCDRLKLKMKSTSHYADHLESSLCEYMDSEKMQQFVENWIPEMNGTNAWANCDIILKEYQIENLPKEIFQFEHLIKFFLPENDKNKTSVELTPIPVIGVPIVNGVHWLKRLIDSVDYPVNELFIVNNNGRDQITNELDELVNINHPFINKIRVCHLPSNIGVSGAWNLIIKSYLMSPYWMIVNNDVSFSPGLLKSVHNEAINTDSGMIHCKKCDWGSGFYDLFLIKDWVVERCGLFDENLYPAYAEDVDYYMRVQNENIKSSILNLEYFHGDFDYNTSGSQTWKIELDLKDKIDKGRIMNETMYLNKKWGDFWNNRYDYPYNNKYYNSKYTSYDLNFVRQKYLGF